MKFSRILIFSLLLILLPACSSFSLAEDITPPPGSNLSVAQPTQVVLNGPRYPLVPPNPANGETLYAEKCAPCHGSTGKGDGPQANELPNPPAALGTSETARQSTPADWYTLVTQGNLDRYMPPFSNSLNERQRWDVIAYAYSLSTPPGTIAQGEELYQANCASCHGSQGRGDGPQAANLEAMPTDFTNQAFMTEKSAQGLYQAISEGIPPEMPSFADTLNQDERWALTAYMRSLTFATSGETAMAESTPIPGETPLAETTPGIEGAATPGAATTSTAQTGTVTGQVINASGGQVPDGLAITLHGFDNMQEMVTMTTTVQTDGEFNFEDVDLPVGRAYIASVSYDNTIYGSDIAMVEEGTTSLEMLVPIYETTTDKSVLSVDRLHIFFEYQEPDTLRVVELFIISNLSDRTLVASSEGDPVLTFDLPAGATNLQFEDGSLGGRYVETGNGFGDTNAVRPGSGQHQVVVAYDLPYKSKLDLTHPVNLPVNAIVLLVPEDGLKVKSDQLQDAGARDVQGMTYHMYTSERLNSGTDLSISISGRPSGGGLGIVSNSSSSLVIGLVVFGLTLVVAGVWLYRRNQVLDTEDLVETDSEGKATIFEKSIPNDPDALMDAIIALDDLYQSGELPKQAYQQRRAELKAHLKDLLGK
jgi:mono/diheme cytochrome c family protein